MIITYTLSEVLPFFPLARIPFPDGPWSQWLIATEVRDMVSSLRLDVDARRRKDGWNIGETMKLIATNHGLFRGWMVFG